MQLFRSVLRPPVLEPRHYPSGYSRLVDAGRLAFADYVALNRDMLHRIHSGAGAINVEKIVDGNAPFELKPPAGYPAGKNKTYRRGVLLTHGLSDSPYFMRHLGAFFQENGFRVMAVLLPGHGTQPGDLLDVSWQEWAAAVTYGVDRLAEEAEEVYLAGYSVGGTLSVLQSLRDKRVQGLFLFSPAFRISSRAVLAQFHKIYSWLIPSGKWLELKPDHDIYKYESFPKNAAAQMYALTREVNHLLHQYNVDIPVFAAASADDTTVAASATLEFFAHTRHPSSKLVLYTTDTENFSSGFPEGKRAVGELGRTAKLELVNSVFPEQNILSFSHTSIVLPADDTHYGASGDYSNCVHYYPGDIEKFAACNNNPHKDLQGELTENNLKAGILRRLMYNPNYSELKDSMRKFIDDLS
jgi:esterase/lipase